MELAGVPVELTVTDTAPDVIDAQWMDDREVTAAFTDDVTAAAFARMLERFAVHAAELADRPTTAAFALPSRDVVRARVARDAGFLPASVLAVADLRRPAAGVDTSPVVVRDAVAGDAGDLAALWCEQADYEAAVGTLRTSDPIRAAIDREAVASIEGSATVLIAEHAGRLAGAVIAHDPGHSQWAADRLTLQPSSYLAMASTSAHARSQGVGTRLVAELHRRHRAAGIAASTLHYSAFNPLSVPFWSQQRYRPVVTLYARAVTARGR